MSLSATIAQTWLTAKNSGCWKMVHCILAAFLVAATAQFVSDNYQPPTLLMALLFGIAFASRKVLSVTLLSTVAIIVYPILITSLDLSMVDAGVFLGGKIHDVAQFVGAGFSVSHETGEIATIVILLGVSMLTPIILII